MVFKYGFMPALAWTIYELVLKPYMVVRYFRKFGKLCAASKTFIPLLGDLPKI